MNKIKVADAIILNNKKQILLTKRSQTEDFSSYWSLPGGAVRDGENILKSLKREIFEELNVNFVPVKFFKKYVTNEKNKFIETRYYIGNIIGEIKTNNEIDSWGWINIDKNLLELDLAFSQNDVIGDFFSYWQKT